MKLSEFQAQWEKDGFEFKDLAKPKVTREAVWYLFGLFMPYSTYEYGRHSALMVALDPKTNEILAHNFKNITSNGGTQLGREEWLRQVREWWEEHVEEGLVYA